jgi:acyl-CoA thioester hydrolase
MSKWGTLKRKPSYKDNGMTNKHVTYYRVIYGDCDSMAILYYANYLRLFEIGRTEWLRERGITYREVESRGYFLPSTEAYLKYHKPAAYDDMLAIETTVGFVKRASARFDYIIALEGERIAEGYTIHACLDKNDQIVRFPDFLLTPLKGA